MCYTSIAPTLVGFSISVPLQGNIDPSMIPSMIHPVMIDSQLLAYET